jgi:hypothetical protein
MNIHYGRLHRIIHDLRSIDWGYAWVYHDDYACFALEKLQLATLDIRQTAHRRVTRLNKIFIPRSIRLILVESLILRKAMAGEYAVFPSSFQRESRKRVYEIDFNSERVDRYLERMKML